MKNYFNNYREITIILIAFILYITTLVHSPEYESTSILLKTIWCISGIIYYYLLIDCAGRYKKAGIALLSIILCYEAFDTYSFYVLSLDRSFLLAPVIISTDLHEASAYLTLQNFGIVFLLCICIILFSWGSSISLGKLSPEKLKRSRRIGLIEFFFLLVLIGSQILISQIIVPQVSSFVNFSLNAQVYLRKHIKMVDELISLPNIASLESNFTEDKDGLITVLFVGEAARSDHFQINGYHRATTPNLMKRMEKGEIITYPNALSYETRTTDSMIGIFTDATLAYRTPQYGSFVNLFDKHGFQTAFFHNHLGPIDYAMKAFTDKCHSCFVTRIWQHQSIPDINKFISTKASKNIFLVLQTQGSHYPYSEGYPSEFSNFKPDQNMTLNSSENPDLINAYDNTIYYLDYCINEIIKILENKRAIFIYVSDHGESLGEEGRYIHAGRMTAMEQRKVPFIIWMSKKYKDTHPNIMETLKSHESQTISHDFLFYSVPGLSDIRFETMKDNLNLAIPLKNK